MQNSGDTHWAPYGTPIKSTCFSVMKVQVKTTEKPPRPTEVTAEDEENLKQTVKEGGMSTSCGHKKNWIISGHSPSH